MKNDRGRNTCGLITQKSTTLRARNRTGSKVQTAEKNKREKQTRDDNKRAEKVRNNYIFRRGTATRLVRGFPTAQHPQQFPAVES